MKKRILKQAVTGTERGQYAKKAANNYDTYHTFLDFLSSSICTTEPYKENNNTQSGPNGILYVGLKHLGRRPSYTSSSRPITSAFSDDQNTERLYNRYFNCWTPGCSIWICRKPCNPACIKKSSEQWRKAFGFKKKHDAFRQLSEV